MRRRSANAASLAVSHSGSAAVGNSLNRRLRTGDVVLVDPADMLKAMRGWTEFDCLFVIDDRLPQEGHQAAGNSKTCHGWRVALGPTKPMDWNVGEYLICLCHEEEVRCNECGRKHETWVRADGTRIKGQPCPEVAEGEFTGKLF